MAEVKFAKGSEEWQMFMDYWALCQKYWEPERNDSYWENVVRDTDDFYKKYNTDFARALAMQLVNELERKYRNGKRGLVNE